LSKHSIPVHAWLIGAFLTLALVCASLSVFGRPTALAGIGAIVFVLAGLGLWLRTFLRFELPLQRALDSIKSKGSLEDSELGALAPYRGFLGEVCNTRSRAKDILKTCYEIAAKLICTRQAERPRAESLLDMIDNLCRRCEGLRQNLGLLADTIVDGRICGGKGTGDCAGSSMPRGLSKSENPVFTSAFDEVISSAREMADLLREVDQNAKELTASTEETAYSMSRLDSFLQDMANSGKELESSTDTANRVALEGTKVVGEMAKENEAIITTVKEAADTVEDLGRWSQEVGKIVEVIRDIANETNLLALNAAIIAAQSGEHGKAFGVVAEEIRGLAERTSSSTQEISDLVKSVQKTVANVIQGMKKSLQRVERGELLTRNAGMVLEKVFESFESSRSMAKQIAASTFEHKIDSSHVVRSIQRVAEIARRLESRKFGKWTVAGEKLATARMAKALAQNTGEVGSDSGSPVPGPAIASTLTAEKPCGSSVEERLDSVVAQGKNDIDQVVEMLRSIRENLCTWVVTLDEAAEHVRGALRRVPPDAGGLKPVNCWEITGCDEETRNRCHAGAGDDWRCFLAPDGWDRPSADGDGGNVRDCVECPALKNNLEA
jgi:methyl-accepting chemotaxis protein